MNFRAGIAALLVLLPQLASGSTLSCQAALDEYLASAERSEWFSTNLKVGDFLDPPFLDRAEQGKRAANHDFRAQRWLTELLSNCFIPNFLYHPVCNGLWTEVTQFTNLAGASLSRTDTLNRDPVPPEAPGLRQQIMEQDQLLARANVAEFRKRRNSPLLLLRDKCLMNPKSWPNVGPLYQVEAPVDAAVELARESFSAGVAPYESNLDAGTYACRTVRTDGEGSPRIDEFRQRAELVVPLYQLSREGDGYSLQGDGYEALFPYAFRRDGPRMVSHQTFRSTVSSSLYLRVTGPGSFGIEVLSRSSRSAQYFSVAEPESSLPVYSYWSCRKK